MKKKSEFVFLLPSYSSGFQEKGKNNKRFILLQIRVISFSDIFLIVAYREDYCPLSAAAFSPHLQTASLLRHLISIDSLSWRPGLDPISLSNCRFHA